MRTVRTSIWKNATGRVHFGPGGDAVTTLDVNGRCYWSPKLVDVYDFARLIDWLEHVHDFSQVVLPRKQMF